MASRALIVDDSRTSRVVLSRTLKSHDLDVDMAESAEAALEYLVDNRPDVIFMDHMMPGMDGFEAVAAIKKNPRTATIPIMMYTSKKGEVYVGQARALGAIGVLPKDIEPVEVSKILESLHIIGEEPRSNDPAVYDLDGESDPAFANLDADMRIMLERLFDEQRMILKHDIQQTSDSIASKVANQIKTESEDDLSEGSIASRDSSWLWMSATALALLSIVLLALLIQRGSQLRELEDDRAALQTAVAQNEFSATASEQTLLSEIRDARRQVDAVAATAVEAVEWGFNRGGQFAYGEEPLGDSQIDDFESLVQQLEALGFVGEVFLETHVGEHCLSLEAGGYVLAEPAILATDCTVRGMSFEEGVQMSNRQSIAMADFMVSTEARTSGAIRFVVTPRGATNPLRPYPVGVASVTAGEWNAIADENNRVQISVIPSSQNTP